LAANIILLARQGASVYLQMGVSSVTRWYCCWLNSQQSPPSAAPFFLIQTMTIAFHRPRALNGWQRLWVIYSIFVGILVGGVAAANWPLSPGSKYGETVEPAPKPFESFDPTSARPVEPKATPAAGFDIRTASPVPITKHKYTLEVHGKIYDIESERPLSDLELRSYARQLEETPTAKVNIPSGFRLESPVEVEKIRNAMHREEIVKHVLTAVCFWAGIILGTYTLGWSVAWVRRGFRNAA
jgi:hypothetical protein